MVSSRCSGAATPDKEKVTVVAATSSDFAGAEGVLTGPCEVAAVTAAGAFSAGSEAGPNASVWI